MINFRGVNIDWQLRVSFVGISNKPHFDAEQVSDIKNALNLFGDDKQSHLVVRDFLYITATQKGKLDNWEQIKASREVDNVVEEHYDQQQKRGFLMRR